MSNDNNSIPKWQPGLAQQGVQPVPGQFPQQVPGQMPQQVPGQIPQVPQPVQQVQAGQQAPQQPQVQPFQIRSINDFSASQKQNTQAAPQGGAQQQAQGGWQPQAQTQAQGGWQPQAQTQAQGGWQPQAQAQMQGQIPQQAQPQAQTQAPTPFQMNAQQQAKPQAQPQVPQNLQSQTPAQGQASQQGWAPGQSWAPQAAQTQKQSFTQNQNTTFAQQSGQPFAQPPTQTQGQARQSQSFNQPFSPAQPNPQTQAQPQQQQPFAQQQGQQPQVFGQPYSQAQSQTFGQTAQTYEKNVAQTAEQPQEEAAKKKKKNQKKEKKQKVAPAPTVEFDKGCCGAAWADIRATKRWFGKLLILALIRFIPIINWVINGYALRWSRELMLGKVEGMPKHTFCKRAFANGAMVFLISLIVGIIVFALTIALGFVPFIGGILGVLLTIFINMIMNFCYIRMAIFDQMSEGFAINKGFDCIRRQFGKALCIEILPKLIIGVIISLIVGIFIALFVAINGNALYNEIMSFANQYSSWRAFEYAIQTDIQAQMELGELIVKNLVLCTPWLIGCVFLTNACNCLTTLIKTRACGHFVTRYCSDWTQESKFASVLQCEEVQPSEV